MNAQTAQGHLHAEYAKASSFAAGFAEQQAIDRDAGFLDDASFCQASAAKWSARMMDVRERIAVMAEVAR